MACQPKQTTADKLATINGILEMILEETDRSEKIQLIKSLYNYTESHPRLLRKYPALKRMLYSKAVEFCQIEELRGELYERMRAAIHSLESHA